MTTLNESSREAFNMEELTNKIIFGSGNPENENQNGYQMKLKN